MRLLVLSLALLASACVDQRYFAPRENLNGTGPGGYPAAVYPFTGDGFDGELRIWSRGARGDDGPDGASRVEVHVGFELENNGRIPLELTGIRSERDDLSLVRVEGETRAEPGSTAQVDSWFLAPGAESARALEEFAIRFAVRAGDREILSQVTPFGIWYRRGPDDFYDPWFFGPRHHVHFGFGYAWGWRCF